MSKIRETTLHLLQDATGKTLDLKVEQEGQQLLYPSPRPDVEEFYYGDSDVVVRGIPRAAIYVTLPSGRILQGEIDDSGRAAIQVPSSEQLEVGDEIGVTQQEIGHRASSAVYRKVLEPEGGGDRWREQEPAPPHF